MNCTGSIAMAAGIEEVPPIFAAEGTAAHQLCERCLQDGSDAAAHKGTKIQVGEWTFTVDAEMVEAVQLYLDVVREIAESSDEFETEQRMNMEALVPGVFGTGDVIAYRERDQRVTIVDFKYGKGVAVDVEGNEQLLTYAAGVVQRFHNRGVSAVDLLVVQPRAPHRDGSVRRWSTDLVGLYDHLNSLKEAEGIIAGGEATLNPGAWCKFCKAAGLCRALDRKVREIIMFDAEKKPFANWKEEEADIVMVKGWAAAREQFAHAEAMRGRVPPGAKLVAKKAFRKWKDEDAAVAALKGELDVTDLYEMKLLSPAQVEKLLPKKSKALVKDLAEAKSSGSVLAPLDDPRTAVDPSVSGFEAVDIEDR